MKKLFALGLAVIALALAGCETPREQGAVGGALIGAGSGALIGSAITGGRSNGAWAGAALGGAAGALIGANSAQSQGQQCWQDQYGRTVCQQQRQQQVQRVYVQERPVYRPRCYRDDWGRRFCER
jgi:osmotically inducible lipoprotein OsmB